MNLSIFNSKKFPKALMIAIAMVPLTIIVVVFYLQKTDTLPAPMFARRFSFDEKLRFMRINDSYDVDFIALGSSTGLSGISSEAMFNHPEIKKSYFNFSVWNLTTHGIFDYWKFIEEITSPRVVILYLDLYEFMEYKDKLIINENDLRRYLDGGSPIRYYFKYHASGFGKRIGYVGHRRTKSNHFYSVQFDEGGGVSLEFPEEKISKISWYDGVVPENFVESSYSALDELLKRMKKKDIFAILVQGAIRESYSEDNPDFRFLNRHFERLESIAKENSMLFFDMKWALSSNESFFADSSHLNREGAYLFTRKLLERMEKEGIFQKVGDNIAHSK